MIPEATLERTSKPVRKKMSFEEFMASTADQFAEWVDGEVIVFMAAKDSHQRVLNFLNHLLDLFVTFMRLGKIRIAPYAMRAMPGGSVREPDILFVAQENLSRITEELLLGPADLVVEIVSDDSVRRDRNAKFHEYRDAGIPEYWVLDPRDGRNRADFYRLTAEGQYDLFATEDDERVESAVISGFWLRPSWLWEAETRDPLQTFFEILSPEQTARVRQMLLSE
jgi:Uma2 family endonuclease